MHGPRCEKKRFLSVWNQYLHTGTDKKKKNGIANEHVDVISTGIVCLPSSRVGASKYEPNGNFCDLCPNYADSASDGGVTYCDATAPVAIQSGCSAKTAEFITASWKNPQHSKTNRIVIILLEIGSQCCWKSKTKPHWIWTEEHSVYDSSCELSRLV